MGNSYILIPLLSMLFAGCVSVFIIIQKFKAASNVKGDIRKLHIDFADKRGLDKTYCPSEVARAYQPESWRQHMRLVCQIADNLVNRNELVVLQKGKIISDLPSLASGPIRLRKI